MHDGKVFTCDECYDTPWKEDPDDDESEEYYYHRELVEQFPEEWSHWEATEYGLRSSDARGARTSCHGSMTRGHPFVAGAHAKLGTKAVSARGP